MQCKRVLQGLCHIASSIFVFCKVRNISSTLDIATIICTTCLFQCNIWTFINHATFLKLNLRTIIYARNTTECKHQCQVLCPSILTLAETLSLWRTIRSIVMGVNIGNIPCSVVVVFIAMSYTPCFTCRTEVPVHREVDNTQTRILAVVRCMIVVATEQGVL